MTARGTISRLPSQTNAREEKHRALKCFALVNETASGAKYLNYLKNINRCVLFFLHYVHTTTCVDLETVQYTNVLLGNVPWPTKKRTKDPMQGPLPSSPHYCLTCEGQLKGWGGTLFLLRLVRRGSRGYGFFSNVYIVRKKGEYVYIVLLTNLIFKRKNSTYKKLFVIAESESHTYIYYSSILFQALLYTRHRLSIRTYLPNLL